MNISAYRADYLPLIGQLMNQMNLPRLINEVVTKPNSQAIVDAGTMISGMILNLLSDAKIRLYRLSHFFELHEAIRIDTIGLKGVRPVLFSQGKELADFDLVVGAFGVNSTAGKMTEALGFGYQEPKVVTAAICELVMDADIVTERFGSSIHLFLLPDSELKFAALIPKGPFVTLYILGKELSSDQVAGFLENPVVKKVLPDPKQYSIPCLCLPKMNVAAPKVPFMDRVVMCGDAGSTRLFKDGLGAAYLMGRAAAKTAIFDGVGREHFQASYLPVYKSIVQDNLFGRML